ncbi:MAG: leucine-rich repeat domain-containing protein [Prevotella sp.]|nr:leucine-rich repeat domain-containing protein [Prevotella sp.]
MKHFNVTFLLTILFLMVGAKAFAYDAYIDGIRYNYSGGNATVTYMNDGHYSGTIVIPASVTYSGKTYNVTSIGDYAFDGCSGLTSITIPESVTSIGRSAFYGCSGLNSITIPNSVTSIGGSAFYGCNGLTSIIIPEGVTSIGSDAFQSCGNLTSVILNSNSIVSASYISLSGISNIFGQQVKEYVLGESVTSIGDYAFCGCSGLTSITIPESVTSIGRYALAWCSGLTSITIPEGVTTIGDYAFADCSGLTSITVAASNSFYDSRYNCNAIIQSSTNTLIAGCKNTIIPSDVVSIGNDALRGCSGLTSITIPESVTSIGGSAFSGCSGLTSITISEGVSSIGGSAFRDCGNLTSVILNSNNIVSASYTSSSCISNIFGRQVKEYVLGEGVMSIGNNAFYDCSGLTSITISESVTSIGNNAFRGCSGLTSITIPKGVTSIGNYAFRGCI